MGRGRGKWNTAFNQGIRASKCVLMHRKCCSLLHNFLQRQIACKWDRHGNAEEVQLYNRIRASTHVKMCRSWGCGWTSRAWGFWCKFVLRCLPLSTCGLFFTITTCLCEWQCSFQVLLEQIEMFFHCAGIRRVHLHSVTVQCKKSASLWAHEGRVSWLNLW